MPLCMCVCVCACVRACVRACQHEKQVQEWTKSCETHQRRASQKLDEREKQVCVYVLTYFCAGGRGCTGSLRVRTYKLACLYAYMYIYEYTRTPAHTRSRAHTNR